MTVPMKVTYNDGYEYNEGQNDCYDDEYENKDDDDKSSVESDDSYGHNDGDDDGSYD